MITHFRALFLVGFAHVPLHTCDTRALAVAQWALGPRLFVWAKTRVRFWAALMGT